LDPRFAKSIHDAMRQQAQAGTTRDPWCIGFFVDNEIQWGTNGRGIATRVLKANPAVAAKQAFVNDLQNKYPSIADLNQAWGSHFDSWEAIIRRTDTTIDNRSAAASADCTEFGNHLFEAYYRIVREEVKAAAPKNLYLGSRIHDGKERPLIQIVGKYCDVVSLNIYGASPDGVLRNYVNAIDMPILIGEFGVGSDPLQTPFRGGDSDSDPDVRVANFKGYLEHAFVHPALVGCHFFQYMDQCISGRPDGEAVLRGFVNTTDTPHLDMIQMNRKMAYSLYQRRTKQN
jgi:hypothetical protein